MTQLTVTLFMGLLLACACPSQAEIRRVTIGVNGMTCSSCSFGCEKQLNKVTGIDKIELNLKQANATVTAKEGKSLDLFQVRDAIKKAGYTPAAIQFVVIGNVLLDQEQRFLMQSRGDGKAFALNVPESIRNKMVSYAKDCALLEITAVISEPMEDMSSVSVTSITEI